MESGVKKSLDGKKLVSGKDSFTSVLRANADDVVKIAKELGIKDKKEIPNLMKFIDQLGSALKNSPAYIKSQAKGASLGALLVNSGLSLFDLYQGFKTKVLKDNDNNIAEAYSIASGLDYPAVGPEHAYLSDVGRVKYVSVGDSEALQAFYILTKTEGIIPALESSHAVAYGIKLAKTLSKDKIVLINLSGRGDKDIEFVLNKQNNGVKQ